MHVEGESFWRRVTMAAGGRRQSVLAVCPQRSHPGDTTARASAVHLRLAAAAQEEDPVAVTSEATCEQRLS